MDDMLMFTFSFSGIWAFFGIIFCMIGVIMLNNRKKKEAKCTLMTYGKVTDIVRHRSYDSDGGYSSSWHPVFEYNIEGIKYIKESPYGSSKPKYAIGQDVKIFYNPENNDEYYIAGDMLSKNIAIIFIIVGVVSVIISAISAITLL